MDKLTLLKRLVSIPSVFPKEKKITDFLASHLGEIGFRVQKIPTHSMRNNIIATYGQAKNYLGFYAHADTVPPEDRMKDPYALATNRDIAVGLGVEDIQRMNGLAYIHRIS